MTTYIINLERCTDRRQYMEQMLADYPFINAQFVNGVDGYKLSNKDKADLFDMEKAAKHLGRNCSDGEIGCVLSHRKCWESLKNSDKNYALIFEDDLAKFNGELVQSILTKLHDILTKKEPTIVLLTGSLWYSHIKNNLIDKYKLASVKYAWIATGYLINKEAAALLLSSKPYYIADDWNYIRRMGISLYGVVPHLIDPYTEKFDTSMHNDTPIRYNNKNISFSKMDFKGIWSFFTDKIRRKFLHFEY